MKRALGYLLCVMTLLLSEVCLSSEGLNSEGLNSKNLEIAHAAPQQANADSQRIKADTNATETKPPISISDQSSNQIQNQSPNQATLKSGRPKAGDFSSVSAPDIGSGLIQVTFGLFVVLMIIAAAAWFTRRFGHFQATVGGSLRIIGGLHVGTKERVLVVQVGEEQLLLGVAPGRVTTLHVLAKPLNDSGDLSSKDGRSGTTRQTPGNFREYLTAILKRDSK